jgi:hypothetical protein
VVSTQGSDSCNPSSNLGIVFENIFYILFFIFLDQKKLVFLQQRFFFSLIRILPVGLGPIYPISYILDPYFRYLDPFLHLFF